MKENKCKSLYFAIQVVNLFMKGKPIITLNMNLSFISTLKILFLVHEVYQKIFV